MQDAAGEFSWCCSHRGVGVGVLFDCLRARYRREELMAAHRQLVNPPQTEAGLPPWEGRLLIRMCTKVVLRVICRMC